MKRMCAFVAVIVMVACLAGCSAGSGPSSSGSASAPGSSSTKSASVDSTSTAKHESGSASAQGAKLTDGGPLQFVGKMALVEGDMNEFPHPRLWAALELDAPVIYEGDVVGEIELNRLQIGPVATEGEGQPYWEPYVGEHVTVEGTLKGATWNFWHLTPCTLEDAKVVSSN